MVSIQIWVLHHHHLRFESLAKNIRDHICKMWAQPPSPHQRCCHWHRPCIAYLPPPYLLPVENFEFWIGDSLQIISRRNIVSEWIGISKEWLWITLCRTDKYCIVLNWGKDLLWITSRGTDKQDSGNGVAGYLIVRTDLDKEVNLEL